MRTCALAVLAACGSSPYEGPNRIFVSSTVHTGSFGGTAGGDAICQARADEAGLEGTFVAWLGATAVSMLALIENERGWVLVDGSPVAARPSDFFTSAIIGPIARDEYGRDVRPTLPRFWTGTEADGRSSAACRDWTSASAAEMAFVGAPQVGGQYAINAALVSCDSPSRLLCLELGRTRQVSIAQSSGRFAFVSERSWQPNANGIDSADAACNTEAMMASLPGTYKALLAPTGIAPASRFDVTGPPWIRIDGALLADTAVELFTNQHTRNFPSQTAAGTLVTGTAIYWSVDPYDIVSTTRCDNWTSTTPTSSPLTTIGSPLTTEHKGLFAANSVNCADADPRLLCLQD